MPRYVVRGQDALNDLEKPLRGCLVLVLGVAYKPDVADLRESPALRSSSCCRNGGHSAVPRPVCAQIGAAGWRGAGGLASLTDEDLAVADCVLVHTAHSCYDLARVARTATLVRHARGRPSGRPPTVP